MIILFLINSDKKLRDIKLYKKLNFLIDWTLYYKKV